METNRIAGGVLPAVAFLIAATASAQTDVPLGTLLRTEQGLMSRVGERSDDPEMRRQMAVLRARIAAAKQREGDKDGAIDYLYNSLQLDPNHPDLLELLGDLANFVGHPSSDYIVQYAYEEALKRDPDRLPARAKLAAAYLSSDRFLRAMEEFETVVRQSPQPNWDHIGLLASVYAMVEEIPRGVEFFGGLAGERRRNEFQVAGAILEHAAGRDDSARSLLRRVIETEEAQSELAVMAIKLDRQYEQRAK
jgi:tetratricopeptide (TPR) repeat protein